MERPSASQAAACQVFGVDILEAWHSQHGGKHHPGWFHITYYSSQDSN